MGRLTLIVMGGCDIAFLMEGEGGGVDSNHTIIMCENNKKK